MAKRRASASPEGALPPAATRRSSRITNGADASHSSGLHADECASARDLKRGDRCIEAQQDTAPKPDVSKGTTGSPKLSSSEDVQAPVVRTSASVARIRDLTISQILNTSPKAFLKRKRSPEAALHSPPATLTPGPPALTQDHEEEQQQETEEQIGPEIEDPVRNWVLKDTWPAKYFEPDENKKEVLSSSGEDSWAEEMAPDPPPPVGRFVMINGRQCALAVPKTPLRRKRSNASIQSGTQSSSDATSTPSKYQDARYESLLEAKGSFFSDVDGFDRTPEVMHMLRKLLTADAEVPHDSPFRDDLFDKFCKSFRKRNEAWVNSELTRLLFPSATRLALYGAEHLDGLVEMANESWTECVPFEGPRPQPDFCTGFKRSAFTEEQLQKLGPFVGTAFDTSFYAATFRMYFPFFTCEVKCNTGGLDVADRQNAHCMTVAVRGMVELYRLLSREKELDRVILAFSISHDDTSVRIYGHYPVINGKKITYHRHEIHNFAFVANGGREKWTSYKFTKNVYDIWVPIHHARICSVIDQLPSDVDFSVSDNLT